MNVIVLLTRGPMQLCCLHQLDGEVLLTGHSLQDVDKLVERRRAFARNIAEDKLVLLLVCPRCLDRIKLAVAEQLLLHQVIDNDVRLKVLNESDSRFAQSVFVRF